jgi:uncharacterized protein YbjT (DUF2867 family)
MIAIVIGGTGLTGSALIRQLLDDPAIAQVISVSRTSLRSQNAKLIEVLVPDLQLLPSVASRLQGDLYFSCLGTTIKTAGSKEKFDAVDRGAMMTFAKIARACNPRSFTLISATGADPDSMFFYNQVKGRAEEEVTALGFRSLLIFRPALLVGQRREFRMAERVAEVTLVPLSRILPSRIAKNMITPAEYLAGRMIDEAKLARPGTRVIHASEI